MKRLLWLFLATACSNTSDMDSDVIVDERGRVPDLVCPGARGCGSNDGALQVGAAKRSVTPDVTERPVWIAGFGRGRQATGVHDDIWMRALVLRRGDVGVGLVVLDSVGYLHDEVTRIRRATAEAGLDLDHIMVATTHNHEAPDTMGIWGETAFQSGYDDAFMAGLVTSAVDALREASERALPASVTAAQVGGTEHLIHDSRAPEVKDPTITALRFVADDDSVISTMTIWGNHPEALGGDNPILTSDYPHYVRETLEAKHPGSIALFFIGTVGGLMNPLNIAGCPDEQGRQTCPAGTFELAEYIGTHVGEMAHAALESAKTGSDTLAFKRHSMLLFPDNLALAAAFQAGLLKRSLYGQDGRKLPRGFIEKHTIADAMRDRLAFLETEVNAITVGDVEILTVPGELYPELWLEDGQGSFVTTPEHADHPDAPPETPLASLLPADKLRAVLNHGNDALGYIIPKPQFDREEPFAYRADGQYGEEYSLGPDTAPDLLKAVESLYALRP